MISKDLCISTFHDSTISYSRFFAYVTPCRHVGKFLEAWNLSLLSDVLDLIQIRPSFSFCFHFVSKIIAIYPKMNTGDIAILPKFSLRLLAKGIETS